MSNTHTQRSSASLATRKCKSKPHVMPLYHFIPKRKKGKITSAGENMENMKKLEPCMRSVGMWNDYSCCGDSLADPLKVKQNDSGTPGVSSKGWKQGLEQILAHLCSRQHCSHSPKGRNNPRASPWWMDAQSVGHSHGASLLSLKKEGNSDRLQCGWTLGTLCSVKKPSHRRANTIWCHAHEVPRGIRFTGTGSKTVGARDCGRGLGSSYLIETVSVWADGQVLGMGGGEGNTPCECASCHWAACT